VTPLLILKTTAMLLIALWIATAVSNCLERRVKSADDLTPSVQVLLGKFIRIAVMTIAVIVVLGTSGIDLSVLAVATGAVGVGVGLGLQKIVSNFVSGIVLLADKSIKPGDVITIGEHFGWVTNMGTRYTSVDLRDGREVLVPNEDLVTQRVINWSYTSDRMQLQIRFNTSYGDDIKKTQAAAVEAALSVPQVMKEPPPSCHITAFGASALEYVLWAWIRNANEGPTRVRSAVMVALWETFDKQGIAIPKPGPSRVILEQPPPAT
jgi:small-conductance mechanosensitive channel